MIFIMIFAIYLDLPFPALVFPLIARLSSCSGFGHFSDIFAVHRLCSTDVVCLPNGQSSGLINWCSLLQLQVWYHDGQSEIEYRAKLNTPNSSIRCSLSSASTNSCFLAVRKNMSKERFSPISKRQGYPVQSSPSLSCNFLFYSPR
jgi:hypothetical protein